MPASRCHVRTRARPFKVAARDARDVIVQATVQGLQSLRRPDEGQIDVLGVDARSDDPNNRRLIERSTGVLFQDGALFSSLSVGENVQVPLKEYHREFPDRWFYELALLKIKLAGLPADALDKLPSQLSGGMRKRAGLARAMALDPDILFFDEPSAGLDPLSSRRLDDLILELRDSLGATVVVVTHELASIFAIGNNSVFLDAESRTMIAMGDPKMLLAESPDPKVRQFLTRGEAHP